MADSQYDAVDQEALREVEEQMRKQARDDEDREILRELESTLKKDNE